MRMQSRAARWTAAWTAVVVGLLPVGPAWAQETAQSSPLRAALRVNATDIRHTADHHMLIGSNVALWNTAETFTNPVFHGWLGELGLGLVRMPGGSWSDLTYWNGNGVRGENGQVDPTRVKDGYPTVDYSAYAPSFMMQGPGRIREGDWHGNVDVKTLHEYINSIPGCRALVTVNAGTGRAVDAAEWVRWASKKMGWNIPYWEVGNELEGRWQPSHFLPGGGELTGEMYAKRFIEFSKAMKAVDPTIKVGGAACASGPGGYTEDLIRLAGDYVDFVSWHTYPVQSTRARNEMLATAESDPAQAAETVRRMLRKYQPGRADDIELGITEWSIGLQQNLEPGTKADMFGAIWSALFLGSVQRAGIDFATQWDVFTNPRRGALLLAEKPYARKAQYWALWLWSHYMGDSTLGYKLDGPDPVKAFATRSDDAVYVMAINSSEDNACALDVALDGFDPAAEGETALLSHRQYFWDRLTNRPLWSSEPQVDPVPTGASFSVDLPPMSIKCIRIPSADKPGVSDRAEQRRGVEGRDFGPAELRVLIDKSGYEDTDLRGWVLAFKPGTIDPYPAPLPNARLSVAGPARSDRTEVRLAEAAGPFVLKPSGAGEVTVTAGLGRQSAGATVTLKPSVPRPHVLWDFETPTLGPGYRSQWDLSTDDSIRANQRVARIDLKGVVPDEQHRELLVVNIPRGAQIQRENIRGVFFDLSVSPDFHCDDPNAVIRIVMQSPADYWMQLGDVPLLGAGGGWETHVVPVTRENHKKAMYAAFNVWFVLRSNKPVTGSIYIDQAGLMVR